MKLLIPCFLLLFPALVGATTRGLKKGSSDDDGHENLAAETSMRRKGKPEASMSKKGKKTEAKKGKKGKAMGNDTGADAGTSKTRTQVLLNIDTGKDTLTQLVPIDTETATAGDLLQKVSEMLNMHSDYLVLYKKTALLLNNNLITGRNPDDRIGCSSMCDNYEELNAETLHSLGVTDGTSVLCLIRPLRGDHIHSAFAVYVHGELVDSLWDDQWLGTPQANEGETYPVTFADLSMGMYNYHITNLQPHFGVHAGQASWFGDGLIHVHPGTSWQWFHKTEGTGATLDAYLDQVGAGYYDTISMRYPYGSWNVVNSNENRLAGRSTITFPDKTGGKPTMVGGEYDCQTILDSGVKGQNIGSGRHPLRDFENQAHTVIEMTPETIIINSNETHIWRTYHWQYWNQTSAPEMYEHGAGNLWLGQNMGMVVMSFESVDAADTASPQKPPQCMIDMLSNEFGRLTGTGLPHQQSNYYIKGFDGFPYPMPNDQGLGWPLEKPIYFS